MYKFFRFVDHRIFWVLRYIAYKSLVGRLDGNGYFGQASYCKGLANLHCKSGLEIFPGWRIQIINGCFEIGKNVEIEKNLEIAAVK